MSPRTIRNSRAPLSSLVVGLTLAGVIISLGLSAIALAALPLGWSSYGPGLIGRWTFAALSLGTGGSSVVAAGLSGLLLLKARDSPAGRNLAFIAAYLTQFWSGAFIVFEWSAGVSLPDPPPPVSLIVLSLTVVVAPWATLAGVLHLSADLLAVSGVTRTGPPRRGRVLVDLDETSADPAFAWKLSAAGVLFSLAGLLVAIRTSPEVLLPIVGLISLTAFVGGAYLSVTNLRIAFEEGDDDLRDRILWLRFGFSAAFWLLCVSVAVGLSQLLLDLPVPGYVDGMLVVVPAFFAPLLILFGLVMGVFWSGAADPALAFGRSRLLGILTVFGVVVFAGVESLIEELIVSWLPFSGVATVLVSGAITAVLVIPVQRRLARPRSALLEEEAPEGSENEAH